MKKLLFDKNQNITFTESLILGPIISTIQATVTFPLITLRTKLHALRLNNNNVSLLQCIKQLPSYDNLYHGWRAKIARGTLMAIFDTYWINRLWKWEEHELCFNGTKYINKWIPDKKGVKVNERVVTPILTFLRDTLDKYTKLHGKNIRKMITVDPDGYATEAEKIGTANKIISTIASGKLAKRI